MRIIGGRFKRRLIAAPEGSDVTRPTADRVRENLFNLLQGEFAEARVLDLYSGSGALGIEALSRGAAHVTFVENHPRALASLRENVGALRLDPSEFRILAVDVMQVLKRPAANQLIPASMDVIVADPPYRSEWYAEALRGLEGSGLCAPRCIAVFEMPSVQSPSILPCEPWFQRDARAYGAARLEIWQRGDPDDPSPQS